MPFEDRNDKGADDPAEPQAVAGDADAAPPAVAGAGRVVEPAGGAGNGAEVGPTEEAAAAEASASSRVPADLAAHLSALAAATEAISGYDKPSWTARPRSRWTPR